MIPIEDMRDNYYALQVSETHFMGSKNADFNDATCFINHSCDPNLAFENGGLTLVNIRDIDAGEELTWDYSTSIDDGIFEMKCSCGAGNCRDIIKSFRFLDPQIQAHLLPFSLRFIQNLYGGK
ncbi:hypothetical protein FACS189487_10430 [Campylobacterota bacterium]|nr:hypothetical protein FACS189487_10430 [Campylobacterota bacterium]